MSCLGCFRGVLTRKAVAASEVVQRGKIKNYHQYHEYPPSNACRHGPGKKLALSSWLGVYVSQKMKYLVLLGYFPSENVMAVVLVSLVRTK